VNDRNEQLNRIPLFQGLSLEEIAVLDQYLGEMELAAGEAVFREGEKGDFVCFVTAGELEVIKQSLNAGVTTMALLGKGRSIGEMALIDELPRSATVQARSDARLTLLSRSAFEALSREAPEIGIKILKHLARSLSLSLRRTSNTLSDSLDLMA